MSIEACGILIAVNDEVTDTLVENDSADWTTKIGNVRISGGGGSWWRTGQPFTATFDAKIPLQLAPLVRRVAFAVTLEATTGTTLLTPTVSPGGGDPPYRIVFYGDVQSIKGQVGSEVVQFTAVDEMSALLNRRSGLAIAYATGIRSILTAIETAHSLTIAGNQTFPSDAEYFLIDQPPTKDMSNGEIIRKTLAGSGQNMSCDWAGTITAPELCWRADSYETGYYPSISTTKYWTWEAGYPWKYTYGDVGIQWQDFTARITVDGFIGGGADPYGWAQLDLAAQRKSLSNRNVSLSTWINNATECQTAAARLMGHQGEPTWMKLNQFTVAIEMMYAYFDAEGAGYEFTNSVSHDAASAAFWIAAAMLGDGVLSRNTFADGNADFGDWPASFPDSGDAFDTLEALWFPEMTDNAQSVTVNSWQIRTITREWDPASGWYLTFGLDPESAIAASAIANKGNGLY